MRLDWSALAGLRVTVMGLGLHGGGAASAAFLAAHGAQVTVTDLRSEEELTGSIADLAPYSIRYVLGRHDISDFTSADIVVKNPAVPQDSPFLKAARRLESDISIFLSLVGESHIGPFIAVTGTKGKSTTASAIHHVLRIDRPNAKLGGNITVSPLRFIDELEGSETDVPIVLELSSWQLADLRGKGVLKPHIALITNILPDHLNRYASMDAYVADKLVIVADQTREDITVCNYDDPYSARFTAATRGRIAYFSDRSLPPAVEGAWLDGPQGTGWSRVEGREAPIVEGPLQLPGEHNRKNLLAAGLALIYADVAPETIAGGLSGYRGIPHRLECIASKYGRRFYNDSASTIPEATLAAVGSFSESLVLIAGGTDKELDFAPFRRFPANVRLVVLLTGSANAKILPALDATGVSHVGPFDSIERAVETAVERSRHGEVILLSPGCTSFEMFQNEFDRGDKFVRAVRSLA